MVKYNNTKNTLIVLLYFLYYYDILDMQNKFYLYCKQITGDKIMITFSKDILENFADTKPIYMRIYHIIRESVLRGDISSSEKITEEKLAELLHVSRTPIRTALTKLISEGILPNPRNGNREIPDREKRDVLYMLGIFESQAAVYLARRKTGKEQMKEITSAFRELDQLLLKNTDTGNAVPEREFREAENNCHLVIAKNCGNDTLYKKIFELRELLSIFRVRTGESSVASYEQMLNETTSFRLRLLDAIEVRDSSKAEAYMHALVLAEQEMFLVK